VLVVVESTIPNALTDDCAVSSIRWPFQLPKIQSETKTMFLKKARLVTLGSNASQPPTKSPLSALPQRSDAVQVEHPL
jgi:hypothetical protein